MKPGEQLIDSVLWPELREAIREGRPYYQHSCIYSSQHANYIANELHARNVEQGGVPHEWKVWTCLWGPIMEFRDPEGERLVCVMIDLIFGRMSKKRLMLIRQGMLEVEGVFLQIISKLWPQADLCIEGSGDRAWVYIRVPAPDQELVFRQELAYDVLPAVERYVVRPLVTIATTPLSKMHLLARGVA